MFYRLSEDTLEFRAFALGTKSFQSCSLCVAALMKCCEQQLIKVKHNVSDNTEKLGHLEVKW